MARTRSWWTIQLVTELIPEAEAFIRFRLAEMSSRNEHHRFEEISTRVAQKRISSSILIATGPVSSGGDQQRDAESFTTRLPDELPHSAGFAAAASTAPVVVACTVQASGLKSKVLDDLAGICDAASAPVKHVAFFSVHPISEGITHDLQQTAREKYGVTLDIFCGGDIATFLVQQDLVWVARHYLELPSHLVPDPEGEPAPRWYVDLIEGMRRNKGPVALTLAVQGEITHGLRHATWDREANADLPEWLDFMGAFLAASEDGVDTELVFRACYEMAVARFRGMGVAAGVEDLVRRAIDYACTSSQPTLVDDAVTLASYWGGMWRTGVARAEADEIGAALARLRSHLVDLLDATDLSTHPVRAATLIGTLAFAHLLPNWETSAAINGKPKSVEVAPLVGVRLDEFEVDISALGESDVFDIATAMDYLEQLVDLLPQARAYSPRQLGRVFTMFAPLASELSSYEKVRDGLDAAMAEVQGDAATAERCRDRGIAFLQAGKPLKALSELHSAKAKWFSGDTMYGAILTTRFLGSLYARLGLTYAAKMYACSAAALGMMTNDPDVTPQVPNALLEAARFAQLAGTWVDAAGLTEIAVLTRAQLLTDPFEYDKYPELEEHETNAILELSAIRKFWPELRPLIEAAHSRSGWYERIFEVVEATDTSFLLTEDEFQARAAEKLAGPVLGDVGPTRVIDFRALGVRWIIKFDNERATVLTAEGLVAALQVILADIALLNPVFINSTVQVVVDVVPGATRDVDSVDIDASQAEIMASVVLSDSLKDPAARDRAIVATCYQLLHAVHARPAQDLQDLLDPLFRGGLVHKISVGRPYEETAALLNEDHYTRCATATRPPSSEGFRPFEHEVLAPSTAIGSGYDSAEALQAIRERYEVANETLRYTLPRLLADTNGRATVVRLRDAGWLDWQILVTLMNAAFNWRMQRAGIRPERSDPKQLMDLAREPETVASPAVPLSIFADEFIDMHTVMQTVAVARRWQLRGRQEAPGEEAMRDLLTRRYRFAIDDVPHCDLLDCVDEDGNLLPLLVIDADRDLDSNRGPVA